MSIVSRSLAALVALSLFPAVALAHSDAGVFKGGAAGAGPALGHEHAINGAAALPRELYPASIGVDPRKVVNVAVRVNARVVGLRNLYLGKRVRQGEVLGELESAELETVQRTYIATFANREAIKQISMTAEEKLMQGRMGLRWRGMSDRDIRQLEATGEPVRRIAVTAPVSGYLIAINAANNQILNAGVQAGQFTATGTTFASIAKPDAFVIEASVPAVRAARLRKGRQARVFIQHWGREPAVVSAVVQEVYGVVNPVTQRQQVRLKPGRLPPGVRLAGSLPAMVRFEGEAHGH
ncbi:MAG: efflux RND transporter periplasmic adaptor subunit [Pseudomonadota bacterium]